MKLLKYWKPIAIALFIFYGSVTSGNNLNKVPFLQIENFDKLVHLTFYFSLSLLLISSLNRNTQLKKHDVLVINIIFVISYGLMMEVFQKYFTFNRSAEILDAFANTIGCILGVLIFPFLQKFNLTKYL